MNINNMTVGQVLANNKAKAILAREFPTLINTPIAKLYSSMTVKQVLALAKDKVPEDKIQRIIKELEQV